jgi:predicted dehydrogenase
MRTLETAGKVHSEASRHRDWRELLTSHPEKFDAVTIGTPDHMHAAPAVLALRAKKHVYLQKPMAPTLHECRVITQEAAQAGVVTQLGNQGRSSIESRMTVELLRSGAIGKIKEVLLWENKPLTWWPKNTELRSPGDPVPAGLDWNLWLGVREPRPYLENTYHPKNWRAWFDFGVGEMGDMGCHHFDTSFDALQLTAPLRVRQITPGSSGPLWGQKRIVELIFPGTPYTAGDTVQLTWHDGGIEPDHNKVKLPKDMKEFPASATCWIGEHGAIFKNYGRGKPVVLPEASFPASKYPTNFEPRDHYHDWVDAILQGRKACDEFSHGGPLTEAVLVGAMADRVAGEWLEWDARALQFANASANALVRRAYRDGWKVEGLG